MSILFFAQDIDCGYTIKPTRRGGSNEYPQSKFWNKNKKVRHKLQFCYIKVGFEGVFIAWTSFLLVVMKKYTDLHFTGYGYVCSKILR